MSKNPAEIEVEDVEWLDILVGQFRSEHDWENDEDPTATQEMLAVCESIAFRLRMAAPPDRRIEEMQSGAVDPSIPF